MKDKIEKPREFTDAEAEAFTRYLTEDKKRKKIRDPLEILSERVEDIIQKWIRKKGKWAGK